MLMNERKKIEDKIRRKEQEIQELESRVRDGRIYVQALQDVLKMLPKEMESPSNAVVTLREGSAVSLARAIILKKGRPVHINELLADMGREGTRENRTSLASSLAAYVRKGEIFTRSAPNKFGVAELDGPPDDFGDIEVEEDGPSAPST